MNYLFSFIVLKTIFDFPSFYYTASHDWLESSVRFRLLEPDTKNMPEHKITKLFINEKCK